MPQISREFATLLDDDTDNSRHEAVQQLIDDLRADSVDFNDERVAGVIESIQDTTGLSSPKVREVINHLAENAQHYLSQYHAHSTETPEWLKDLPLKSVELYFGLMEGIIKFLIEEEKRH